MPVGIFVKRTVTVEYVISLLVKCGLDAFFATALAKMLFAAIGGGLIGLEREMKGRPAGIKTFSLVCLGATLTMITNEYIYIKMGGSGDITRMAAQVISGIGFLGAGTIMVTGKSQIKGLTTAAVLWVTASLGISIGAGFYSGAAVAIVIIYTCSYVFRQFELQIVEYSKDMCVYVEGENDEFIPDIIKFLRNNHIKFKLLRQEESSWLKNVNTATIELKLGKRRKHKQILQELEVIAGVIFIEEI